MLAPIPACLTLHPFPDSPRIWKCWPLEYLQHTPKSSDHEAMNVPAQPLQECCIAWSIAEAVPAVEISQLGGMEGFVAGQALMKKQIHQTAPILEQRGEMGAQTCYG